MKTTELKNKIYEAAENFTWNVRAPRIKALAEYIKETFGDKVLVELNGSEVTKGRQAVNGIYYSMNSYKGKVLKVAIVSDQNISKNTRNRKKFLIETKDCFYETFICHNTADTYRNNNEVCKKIVELHEILD